MFGFGVTRISRACKLFYSQNVFQGLVSGVFYSISKGWMWPPPAVILQNARCPTGPAANCEAAEDRRGTDGVNPCGGFCSGGGGFQKQRHEQRPTRAERQFPGAFQPDHFLDPDDRQPSNFTFTGTPSGFLGRYFGKHRFLDDGRARGLPFFRNGGFRRR